MNRGASLAVRAVLPGSPPYDLDGGGRIAVQIVGAATLRPAASRIATSSEPWSPLVWFVSAVQNSVEESPGQQSPQPLAARMEAPQARNRLQSQSRQQQPLPAQHREQKQRRPKVHRPHDWRQRGRKSAYGMGDACDGEGKGEPLFGEFENLGVGVPAPVGWLLGFLGDGIIWVWSDFF